MTETLQRSTFEQSIQLATGLLEIRVHRADLLLEDHCGLAARRNVRRGFLFVSKVSGVICESDRSS